MKPLPDPPACQNQAAIASKFGGTSLADAAQIRRVGQIIRADLRRRFIVVSAPGKRGEDDQKVTDLLYRSQSLARTGDLFGAAEVYALVRRRFLELAGGLGVGRMDEWLSEVEAGIAGGAGLDWVVSRGEYLNARLVASFLGATFVDAADAIRFGADGLVMAPETDAALGGMLSGAGLFVVPGFYGREPSGRVRCFSRGGSDITGALVARAVGAGVYENWTDVSGLLMADPRVIENPRPVAEVTYREQRELSRRGATVLHDEALRPVLEAQIPVHIRNTNDPAAPGTRVVSGRDTRRRPIAGIAGRTGLSAVLVRKAMMSGETGLGSRLQDVFSRHGVRCEQAPSGTDMVSLIVRDEEIGGKREAVLREVSEALRPDHVEISGGHALIAVVGEGLTGSAGITARVMTALAGAGVGLRMVSSGLSGISLSVGVAAADYESAMGAIYCAVSRQEE